MEENCWNVEENCWHVRVWSGPRRLSTPSPAFAAGDGARGALSD